MRAAIIPPEKLAVFTRPVGESMRVEPVPIYSGPFAGSYAINESILDSCHEWQAVREQALALMEAEGVTIQEVQASDLRNPYISRP